MRVRMNDRATRRHTLPLALPHFDVRKKNRQMGDSRAMRTATSIAMEMTRLHRVSQFIAHVPACSLPRQWAECKRAIRGNAVPLPAFRENMLDSFY